MLGHYTKVVVQTVEDKSKLPMCNNHQPGTGLEGMKVAKLKESRRVVEPWHNNRAPEDKYCKATGEDEDSASLESPGLNG